MAMTRRSAFQDPAALKVCTEGLRASERRQAGACGSPLPHGARWQSLSAGEASPRPAGPRHCAFPCRPCLCPLADTALVEALWPSAGKPLPRSGKNVSFFPYKERWGEIRAMTQTLFFTSRKNAPELLLQLWEWTRLTVLPLRLGLHGRPLGVRPRRRSARGTHRPYNSIKSRSSV